jgi:hypothetical protein
MTTTVIHVRDRQDGDIYIGRAMPRHRLKGSPFANPFKIGPDGTRDEVIAQYREYILSRPALIAMLPVLKGRRLACWCHPEACHGDVLVELIEGLDAG